MGAVSRCINERASLNYPANKSYTSFFLLLFFLSPGQQEEREGFQAFAGRCGDDREAGEERRYWQEDRPGEAPQAVNRVGTSGRVGSTVGGWRRSKLDECFVGSLVRGEGGISCLCL